MDNLTPEQLRELADKMEQEGSGAIECSDSTEQVKPYVRIVELDGIKVKIDMRRVKDYRTVAMIARIDKGETFAAVELFDFLLGDEQDKVIEKLSDADGFCDAETFVTFCTRLLEKVGAKN